MNERVQAEMGSASLATASAWMRRGHGCARAGLRACLWASVVLILIGSTLVQASDPPAKTLPEFAYDVHLAPNIDKTDDTNGIPPAALSQGPTEYVPWMADLVRVYKAERRLVLFAGGQPIDEFQIALGSRPIGPKRQKGDGRTPEGRYHIDWRKPNSDFFRALHISYPNENDRRSARERGVSPGGSIMIHGLPNGLGMIGSMHVVSDWTDGCIAVTNEEMLQLWDRIPDGIPIEILP